MKIDFSEFTSALETNELEEIPVDVEEFIRGEEYLNRPEITLSVEQKTCILAMTQIYEKRTLKLFMSEANAERRWKQTKNEIILQLGKGSGKDFMSAVACCYVVYLLLCLRDPAVYYGKPSGDSIDILNVAVNADQARNVFFKNVSRLVRSSPWFRGRYDAKASGEPARDREISFNKEITLYSAHSEREAFEGYNTFFVVLDEISAFGLESTSGSISSATAPAIYDMYRASVSSRFARFGKLALLSFPRYKKDFIQQRYNEEVIEKETIIKTHTFKLDPELPGGIEANEFTIEWEHDKIIRYLTPNVFALRRATFEVNPTKTIDEYTRDFFTQKTDTLSRVCCMPPDAIDAFFKDKQKIEDSFTRINGVHEDGSFHDRFRPRPGKKYFIHVDLARVHDHCAVSMAHVETFIKQKIAGEMTEPAPIVVVDVLRWWTPTKEKSVDFTEVREYIVSLQRRGFDIGLVTFDRWESSDMMNYLNNIGIRSERLSVAKKHYTDLAAVLHEDRLKGPDITLLKEEMFALRIMPNDKIDHPRTGSKDLADAMCGSVYDAIAHTPRDLNQEVEVKTWDSVKKENRNRIPVKPDNLIVAPSKNASARIPIELREFLGIREI